MDYRLPGSSVHGDSPGKNTGVGCYSLPQGIFLTQASNLSLLLAGRCFTTELPGKLVHTHKNGGKEFNVYNLMFKFNVFNLMFKSQMFKFSYGNLFFILTMEVFSIIREN